MEQQEQKKGRPMPIAILLAAICAGLFFALIWIGIGGTVLSALVIYTLSGNLLIAAILAQVALRNPRPAYPSRAA
ncbi:hypothetical protein AB2B41_03220 [Marimonas sp. MJW-29]|uniref:Uncharacterized protein n=1 Tax=Sulfitobacter sediminis TaxID=3234186 RepID=A0ABV3RI62_9RHOB